MKNNKINHTSELSICYKNKLPDKIDIKCKKLKSDIDLEEIMNEKDDQLPDLVANRTDTSILTLLNRVTNNL